MGSDLGSPSAALEVRLTEGAQFDKSNINKKQKYLKMQEGHRNRLEAQYNERQNQV